MSSMHIWRARVAYLIISCALWVAIAPLVDSPNVLRIVIGMAILSNVLFMFVTFALPTTDAFQLGEKVGKSIGYQEGYRDGFEQAGPRKGADIFGLNHGAEDFSNSLPTSGG